MRRCISFKELRDYDDDSDPLHKLMEATDSEDDLYDKQFNFISEPNSPRAKEMLLNTNFHIKMGELSKAYFMRD